MELDLAHYLYTVKQLAELSRETPGIWYKRITFGMLPSLKIGGSVRVKREEFEKFLESKTRPARMKA